MFLESTSNTSLSPEHLALDCKDTTDDFENQDSGFEIRSLLTQLRSVSKRFELCHAHLLALRLAALRSKVPPISMEILRPGHCVPALKAAGEMI